MKTRGYGFLAAAVAAIGFAGLVSVFIVESICFRRAVLGWAAHDLDVRTSLAASTLRDPLRTGSLGSVFEAGAASAADGMRLTVFSAGGGVVYDSVADGGGEEYIFSESESAGCIVRLGVPVSRVLAPFRRASVGFLLAALTGAAGVLLFFFAAYRQRVRMREMARVEAFRREFVADVSHEIRTPLTGIIGAADILSDSEPDGSPRAKLLSMLKKESERLNALAQGILDLSRIERAQELQSIARTDLCALAADTVDGLRLQAESAGVALSVSAPGHVFAMCDAQLLSQAVSNLVVNAVRHSGASEVAVSVSATHRAAEIAVEDHGKGIPPEHAARIFERFHRVDAARSAQGGGAGLGLAIVRGIARMHGGDARLETAKPRGCRFVISVPLG